MVEEPAHNIDATLPSRVSPRLQSYDYCLPGTYFVTICTFQRVCLFGRVCVDQMHLNAPGHEVARIWGTIPTHRTGVQLDEYVVMPNHIHGLLTILADDETDAAGGQASMASIVGQFKAEATRAIHAIAGYEHARVWQRSFYDHIVRSESALERVRQYVVDNPARWGEDEDNPERGCSPRMS